MNNNGMGLGDQHDGNEMNRPQRAEVQPIRRSRPPNNSVFGGFYHPQYGFIPALNDIPPDQQAAVLAHLQNLSPNQEFFNPPVDFQHEIIAPPSINYIPPAYFNIQQEVHQPPALQPPFGLVHNIEGGSMRDYNPAEDVGLPENEQVRRTLREEELYRLVQEDVDAELARLQERAPPRVEDIVERFNYANSLHMHANAIPIGIDRNQAMAALEQSRRMGIDPYMLAALNEERNLPPGVVFDMERSPQRLLRIAGLPRVGSADSDLFYSMMRRYRCALIADELNGVPFGFNNRDTASPSSGDTSGNSSVRIVTPPQEVGISDSVSRSPSIAYRANSLYNEDLNNYAEESAEIDYEDNGENYEEEEECSEHSFYSDEAEDNEEPIAEQVMFPDGLDNPDPPTCESEESIAEFIAEDNAENMGEVQPPCFNVAVQTTDEEMNEDVSENVTNSVANDHNNTNDGNDDMDDNVDNADNEDNISNVDNVNSVNNVSNVDNTNSVSNVSNANKICNANNICNATNVCNAINVCNANNASNVDNTSSVSNTSNVNNVSNVDNTSSVCNASNANNVSNVDNTSLVSNDSKANNVSNVDNISSVSNISNVINVSTVSNVDNTSSVSNASNGSNVSNVDNTSSVSNASNGNNVSNVDNTNSVGNASNSNNVSNISKVNNVNNVDNTNNVSNVVNTNNVSNVSNANDVSNVDIDVDDISDDLPNIAADEEAEVDAPAETSPVVRKYPPRNRIYKPSFIDMVIIAINASKGKKASKPAILSYIIENYKFQINKRKINTRVSSAIRDLLDCNRIKRTGKGGKGLNGSFFVVGNFMTREKKKKPEPSNNESAASSSTPAVQQTSDPAPIKFWGLFEDRFPLLHVNPMSSLPLPKPVHPAYVHMIKKAIKVLDQGGGGVELINIVNFILRNYDFTNPEDVEKVVTKACRRLVNNGQLTTYENRYVTVRKTRVNKDLKARVDKRFVKRKEAKPANDDSTQPSIISP
ncbi:unnamed protein product [Auanema sp. JU1783]|nr:unnamed protein product [Auanema sp. JU1783]